MLLKILVCCSALLLIVTPAAASSQVTAKIGSGTGTVSPGSAIIPTGANLDFIINTANGRISYVSLDGMIVSVFKFGGLGKQSAILTIRENGKQRRLMVYFSSARLKNDTASETEETGTGLITGNE